MEHNKMSTKGVCSNIDPHQERTTEVNDIIMQLKELEKKIDSKVSRKRIIKIQTKLHGIEIKRTNRMINKINS